MQNIEKLRDRIFLLLGKHLIRFQTIEMRLKALIKMNKTIVSQSNNTPIIIEPSVQNQTLGGLTTRAINDLFISNSNLSISDNSETPLNSIRIDFNIAFHLDDQSREKLSIEFQNFVQDRNFLTHHFQEKFNLSNLTDCEEAIKFLLELEKKHQPFLDKFEQYCLSTKNSFETHIDFLKSNIFKTHLIFPSDEIYKEIQILIGNNTKNDGWISLTTIVASIFKKFPDANKYIKIEYEFKNLHDLILNSGLFLLKVEPTIKGERILIKPNNGEATFTIIEE